MAIHKDAWMRQGGEMRRGGRAGWCLAVVCALFPWPVPAQDEAVFRNADDSLLRVVPIRSPDAVRYRVTLEEDGEVRRLPDLDDPFREERLLVLQDVDGDGYGDAIVQGDCGSGGCEGRILRFDPAMRRMLPFHVGFWKEVEVSGGVVIELSRGAAGRYVYLVGPPDPVGDGRWGDRAVFTVEIEREHPDAAMQDAEEEVAWRCRFRRRVDDRTREIDPPAARWLRLCALFDDDYRLTRPSDAAGDQGGSP